MFQTIQNLMIIGAVIMAIVLACPFLSIYTSFHYKLKRKLIINGYRSPIFIHSIHLMSFVYLIFMFIMLPKHIMPAEFIEDMNTPSYLYIQKYSQNGIASFLIHEAYGFGQFILIAAGIFSLALLSSLITSVLMLMLMPKRLARVSGHRKILVPYLALGISLLVVIIIIMPIDFYFFTKLDMKRLQEEFRMIINIGPTP